MSLTLGLQTQGVQLTEACISLRFVQCLLLLLLTLFMACQDNKLYGLVQGCLTLLFQITQENLQSSS